MASAKERPNAALPDGEVLPQTGGEFPATRARFKHPSMDVNYKRKECLWSKSPGYFFFLATLRPPPNYCSALPIIAAGPITEGSGWQLPMRDWCIRVGKSCAYTIIYRLGGLVHDTKTLSQGFELHWLFSFFLILTTSILVSVNIALLCWQRWLLKLFVFIFFYFFIFKEGVIYSADHCI